VDAYAERASAADVSACSLCRGWPFCRWAAGELPCVSCDGTENV